MHDEHKVTVNLNTPTPYLENHNFMTGLRRRLTHRYPIKLIKRYSDKKDEVRLFDIGTGSGTFLSEVVKSLHEVDVNGVEFDPRLVKASNERLGRQAVLQGNAEDPTIGTSNSFDVVTSFHVIEHLYEPELLVQNAYRLLTSGGVFLLATPNKSCLAHRLHAQKWQGIRDDHVSLKSAEEWDKLVTASGFTRLTTGTTFFSGVKFMKLFPFNIINGSLSLLLGSLNWNLGESFIGIYRKN